MSQGDRERRVAASPRLLAITADHGDAARLLDAAARAVNAGADGIQWRVTALSDRRSAETLRQLRRRLPERCCLIVNDRPDLALAVDAHGVHAKSNGLAAGDVRELVRRVGGEERARAFLLSRAVHRVDELVAAAADPELDAVTVSPYAASPGKTALGHDGFAALLHEARVTSGGGGLPLRWLALGGLGPEHVEDIASLAVTGERFGLAAIRALGEDGGRAAELAARLGETSDPVGAR
ncbi:MAG: thiamine phosphate synthase [Acidobacteriota bacterium]